MRLKKTREGQNKRGEKKSEARRNEATLLLRFRRPTVRRPSFMNNSPRILFTGRKLKSITFQYDCASIRR